jgi:hypothetical protein
MDHQAPSHCQFLCKLSLINYVPTRKKEDNKVFLEQDDIKKMEITWKYSPGSTFQMGRFSGGPSLHVTYLQSYQALCDFSATVCDVRET